MKKFIAPIIFILIGIICLISFNVIGSEVASDGQIIEPFFLIPIGGLTLFVGIVWAIVAGIIAIVKSVKKKSDN